MQKPLISAKRITQAEQGHGFASALIPVHSIWLRRDAPNPYEAYEWVFYGYAQAEAQLRKNTCLLAVDGESDHYDYRILFADGFGYSGQYELHSHDKSPCLGQHAAQFLTWMRDHLGETGLARKNAATEAAQFLKSYDLNQSITPANSIATQSGCHGPCFATTP